MIAILSIFYDLRYKLNYIITYGQSENCVNGSMYSNIIVHNTFVSSPLLVPTTKLLFLDTVYLFESDNNTQEYQGTEQIMKWLRLK